MTESVTELKILQIACEMTEVQGGPTRSALAVAGYLPVEHKFAIVGNVDSKTETLLNSSGVSFEKIQSDFNNLSGFCFRDLPKLAKMIRESDIVISHGFYTFPTLISCMAGKKKSIYVMPHGSLEEYQWGHSKIKKSLFDRLIGLSSNFKKIIFTVATIEESHSIRKKFECNKIEVVGIAVDLPEVPKLHFDNDSKISLLSISRIAPKKRIDVSIRAVSLMKGLHLEPHLWIYGSGDGKLLSSLMKLALDLNVEKVVHFEGVIDHEDISSVFSKVDILVLPSENENFAIAVAESIAHNVPVIVSRAVALSSFVEENLCGEVIASSDPKFLMDAILKVSSNLSFYRDACNVARHKLGHTYVKNNWKSIITKTPKAEH